MLIIHFLFSIIVVSAQYNYYPKELPNINTLSYVSTDTGNYQLNSFVDSLGVIYTMKSCMCNTNYPLRNMFSTSGLITHTWPWNEYSIDVNGNVCYSGSTCSTTVDGLSVGGHWIEIQTSVPVEVQGIYFKLFSGIDIFQLVASNNGVTFTNIYLPEITANARRRLFANFQDSNNIFFSATVFSSWRFIYRCGGSVSEPLKIYSFWLIATNTTPTITSTASMITEPSIIAHSLSENDSYIFDSFGIVLSMIYVCIFIGIAVAVGIIYVTNYVNPVSPYYWSDVY